MNKRDEPHDDLETTGPGHCHTAKSVVHLAVFQLHKCKFFRLFLEKNYYLKFVFTVIIMDYSKFMTCTFSSINMNFHYLLLCPF